MSSSGGKTYVGPVARSVPFDNATNSFTSLTTQSAIEESMILSYVGSGVDGDVALSAGTTTLVRDMYYNSLTLTGTAILNTGGFKIFCRNTVSLAGTSSIVNNGATGTAAAAGTAGNPGAQTAGFTLGTGQAGSAGGAAGADSATIAAQSGYGGSGGSGGAGGGNAASGAGGVVNYYPEQTFNLWHFSGPGGFKSGGGGGQGGMSGTQPLFTTGGGGGGGGAGAGVVFIVCRTFTNASSVGITAIGGNGGNGGTSNGGGGGGGGAGGGGFIYILCIDLTAGILSVAGGVSGTPGTSSGGNGSGSSGIVGNAGHYSLYSSRTGAWTVL